MISQKSIDIREKYRLRQMSISREKTIMLVTGEVSGDMLGAELMKQFKKLGYDNFLGIGGPEMKELGCEMILPQDKLAIFGVIPALLSYFKLKKIMLQVWQRARQEKPVVVILIDSPGFNLRLMKKIRKEVRLMVQLVCPQIWATRFFRIHTLKKNVDLLLTLFPFENTICEEAGIASHWIGHPLIQRIPKEIEKSQNILQEQSLSKRYRVGLFPGSRRSEVDKLLPPMLAAARLILEKNPRTDIAVSVAKPELNTIIEQSLLKYRDLPIRKINEREDNLVMMQQSDIVITASGTICLEAIYFEKPMIVLYSVRWLDFLIGSLLFRCRFFCIVNILAGKRIVSELMQSEVTAENILEEFLKIRYEATYCENMKQELRKVRKMLGSGNPAKKAVSSIQALIEKPPKKKK